MTEPLDEQLLDAVNALGTTLWSGRTFRYTTARRDPMSGEGARLHGGRWNPPGEFPVIYLADPVAACMRELEKAASDNHLAVAAQLSVPYKLHTLALHEVQLLDLRGQEAQSQLGLDPVDLSGSWEACQPIGHAAWFLEYQGVLAPSAVGDGVTIALFDHRTNPGQVALEQSQDLTVPLFEVLRT